MAQVRFATYNLLNYEGPETVGDRYTKITGTIRGLDVDVLAVQEILAPDQQAAGKVLSTLGDDVGMTCWWTPGQPAVALGHKLTARDTSFTVGLLWRPGIEPVAGRFRAFSEDFWHGLAVGVFDIDGVQVAIGSFHATPFGKRARADQMERLVSIFTRPDGRPPGMVGADWNCVSADRIAGTGEFYDPDPYADQPWFGDLIYQTNWTYDGDGQRHHVADREPGEVLYVGGLRDAAAVLDTPWEPTAGHWPSDDPFGERRIDAIRVTDDMVPALRDAQVARNDTALAASDHLPPVVTVETTEIAHSR